MLHYCSSDTCPLPYTPLFGNSAGFCISFPYASFPPISNLPAVVGDCAVFEYRCLCLLHKNAKSASTARVPKAAPIPIPAFPPVDNPADGVEVGVEKGVEVGFDVEGDDVGVAEVLAGRSVAFQLI